MADSTLPFYAGTKSAEISCIYTFRYFEKKMKYLSKQEMLIFTKRYRNRKEQNSDNQAESDNVDDETCVQSYSFKY